MKRGLTLVEVLVSCFLMGLFTTMVVVAFTRAFRDYGSFEDKVVSYRQAMTVLDRMSRRLSVCQQVYVPNWGSTIPPAAVPTYSPSPYAPTADKPFIFGYFSTASNSVVVVGYGREASTGHLLEFTYRSYPADPSTSRVVATDMSDFKVTAEDPATSRHYNMVQVDLALQLPNRSQLPISNQVVVQSFGVATP